MQEQPEQKPDTFQVSETELCTGLDVRRGGSAPLITNSYSKLMFTSTEEILKAQADVSYLHRVVASYPVLAAALENYQATLKPRGIK